MIVIIIITCKKRKQTLKKCEDTANVTAADEAKIGPNLQTAYLKNDNTGNIPVSNTLYLNKL